MVGLEQNSNVELLLVSDAGKQKPSCPGLPAVRTDGWVPGMGFIRTESTFAVKTPSSLLTFFLIPRGGETASSHLA